MGRNLASGDEVCSSRKERLEWIKISFWKYTITESETKYKSYMKRKGGVLRKKYSSWDDA